MQAIAILNLTLYLNIELLTRQSIQSHQRRFRVGVYSCSQQEHHQRASHQERTGVYEVDSMLGAVADSEINNL